MTGQAKYEEGESALKLLAALSLAMQQLRLHSIKQYISAARMVNQP